MKLFERYMQPCVKQEETRTADGQGGYTVTWQDGESFEAAVIMDGSNKSEIAESENVLDKYTVTTLFRLKPFDVFQTAGLRLRVITNARVTPSFSTFQFRQYVAEVWHG